MRVACAERELLERFTDLSYPKEAFRHAQHVQLAWTLLALRPLLSAMQEFRRLLLAFATHHGATGLYNETITCFYLLLIRERMDRLEADHDWAGFRDANPDLFTHPKGFLERWYPAEAAFSPAARAAFLPPAEGSTVRDGLIL
jgi:hypothetical protein